MGRSLFDHVKMVTDGQQPNYWDTLDEAERKQWSTFMILRFLSMKPEWVELIADVYPYLQEAPPKAQYQCLIGLIPKSKTFLKYMKAKKEGTYEHWLKSLVAKNYEVSTSEAEDYLDILYSTKEGKSHIKDLCRKYAIDEKDVKKLKI
jgi:hypothetical protein